MRPDDEIVETSHGPATVKYVREQDIPHWQGVAAHAQEVLKKLKEAISADG